MGLGSGVRGEVLGLGPGVLDLGSLVLGHAVICSMLATRPRLHRKQKGLSHSTVPEFWGLGSWSVESAFGLASGLDLGLGVLGLGFGGWGLLCAVGRLGLRSGVWGLGSGCWGQGSGIWVCCVWCLGLRSSLGPGVWCVVSGVWGVDKLRSKPFSLGEGRFRSRT